MSSLRGISIKTDPRVRTRPPEIELPSSVTDFVETEAINVSCFEPWISRELAPLTDDDFMADLVMGFLKGKVVHSQELAASLQPTLGDATVHFVSKLWALLLDAKNSELGIPGAIMEESEKGIIERRKNLGSMISDDSSYQSEEEDGANIELTIREPEASEKQFAERKLERIHHHHHHHQKHHRSHGDRDHYHHHRSDHRHGYHRRHRRSHRHRCADDG
jgi:hypothetical protein